MEIRAVAVFGQSFDSVVDLPHVDVGVEDRRRAQGRDGVRFRRRRRGFVERRFLLF